MVFALIAGRDVQNYDLRTLRSTFGWPLWYTLSLALLERETDNEKRVDMLFVDLDGTCRDYTYLRQSEITLAKSQ